MSGNKLIFVRVAVQKGYTESIAIKIHLAGMPKDVTELLFISEYIEDADVNNP